MLNATNNPITPTSDAEPDAVKLDGSTPVSDTNATPVSDTNATPVKSEVSSFSTSADVTNSSDTPKSTDFAKSPGLTTPDHVESSFSPPLPPVILPSSSGTSHPPRMVDAVGNVHQDVTDTTERDSSFSTALATKVNAAGEHPKTGLTDSPFPKATIVSDTVTAKSSGASSEKPKKKGGFNLKVAAGALMMFILVGGLGAGYYLQQQQQDTRNQAASEEVTDAEIVRTKDGWREFREKWMAFLADPTNDWEDYVRYAENDGARYECDTPIARVKEETLYGCDLNSMFVISNVDAYIAGEPISAQDSNLNATLDLLITDSALLQEAGRLGDITLTPEIFNSTEKNTIQRYAVLRQVRELFSGKYEKTVDFEVITIYFHNQIDPKIDLEKAKLAAKRKMDILYERIQKGEITFKEAGAEIRANAITGDDTGVSLADLDEVYKENSYFNITGHKFFTQIFRDEVYDDELRSLGEGQMSTVRLCRDYKYTQSEYVQSITSDETFEPPFVESCYVLFKVNKINLGIEGESKETSAEEVISGEYAKAAERLLN